MRHDAVLAYADENNASFTSFTRIPSCRVPNPSNKSASSSTSSSSTTTTTSTSTSSENCKE